MANLKRYGWIGDTIGVGSNAEFDECKDGDYVKFEDIKEFLKTANNRAKPTIRNCANCGDFHTNCFGLITDRECSDWVCEQ